MKPTKISRSRKSLRGVTLLEVAIASSLLVAFGGAAMLATETAGKSFRTEAAGANLDSAARKAMAGITERLRTADAVTVIAFDEHTLNYRRGIGFDEATETMQLGNPEQLVFEYDPGDPDDGVDNDGDGLIDEGRIVHIVNPLAAGESRVVLCNWVAEDLEGEIANNALDDNGNGEVDEPGFNFVTDGTQVTIRMTLAQLDRQGNRIEHTFEKSIALRNRTP